MTPDRTNNSIQHHNSGLRNDPGHRKGPEHLYNARLQNTERQIARLKALEKRQDKLDVIFMNRKAPERKASERKSPERPNANAGNHKTASGVRSKTSAHKSATGNRQERRNVSLRRHVDERRKTAHLKRQKFFEEENIRLENRAKRLAGKKKQNQARTYQMIAAAVGLILAGVFLEFLVPGSILKRKQIIPDTPIEEQTQLSEIQTDLFPPKEYDTLNGITEQQLLWDLLMDHFEGNKNAVLGVMCNLYCESEFKASNLEDYNNKIWEIEDNDYTELVNLQTIGKKDFLESRHIDQTNGYYNKNNLWVNKDGGYGYAQFTAYEKKERLYGFAENWFGPGGEGEDYKFNIGDAKMQAHFVVHLLESEEYKKMDHMIRTAQTAVDACYYWLKMYEIPHDPYNDGYYTLAFDRAASADEIEAACDHSD